MRCHICDTPITNPAFDPRHNEFDPCHTCLTAIADVFGDEPDSDEVLEHAPEPTVEEQLAVSEADAYRFDVV